jgi:hypothetical protein
MYFDNDSYLDKYNKIIENFQKETMALNMEEFKLRLNHTTTKLNEIKNKYVHIPNIDNYFEKILQDAQKNNNPIFSNKIAAVTRYVSKPLTKESHRFFNKQTNNNNNNNNNIHTNNNSLNSSNISNYSHRTNRSNRNHVSFNNTHSTPRSILRNNSNSYNNTRTNNYQQHQVNMQPQTNQQQPQQLNMQPQANQQQLFDLFNNFICSNQHQLSQLLPQHCPLQTNINNNNNNNNNITNQNENFQVAHHPTTIT